MESERKVIFTSGLTLQSPVVPSCITRFYVKKLYILPAYFIFVFYIDLEKNSVYFPIEH